MTVFLLILAMVLCVVVGVCIGFFLFREKTAGIIQIDNSDPSEPPYLFARLSMPVESLSKKKKASFKILLKNFIAHD